MKRYLFWKHISFIALLSCTSSTYIAPSFQPKEPDKMPQTLRILTYNIQAFLTKDSTKSMDLLTAINRSDFDIVTFQELFTESLRKTYREGINKEKYPSIVDRVDITSFPECLAQDAGLFTLSRYEMLDLSALKLPKTYVTGKSIFKVLKKEFSISLDFLSNKSVLGSLYKRNEHSFLLLFTTHTQALGSRKHKFKQFQEIGSFVKESVNSIIEQLGVSPSQLSILLTGDFNFDAYDTKMENNTHTRYEEMLFKLGSPRDLHKEFHYDKKEFTWSANKPRKRFDYIFSYDSIGSIGLNPIRIENISVTDFKSGHESISDHFALEATLTF